MSESDKNQPENSELIKQEILTEPKQSVIIRKWYISISVIVLIVFFTVTGVLYIQNSFPVTAEVVNTSKSDDRRDETIRENLVKAGFDRQLVDDLPVEEVQRYRNLKSVSVNTDLVEKDGGQCRVTSYYSFLGDNEGLSRLAISYQWIKQPRNAYGDVIGLGSDSDSLTQPNQEEICSYNLYEKQGMAYQFKDIDTQSLYAMAYKRYRVYHGSDISNQRGYFALNYYMSAPSIAQRITITNFYIHQTSFFTSNKVPVKRYENYHDIDNYDFEYHYFVKIAEYNP